MDLTFMISNMLLSMLQKSPSVDMDVTSPVPGQAEVDTLPHDSQEVFYIPQMIFFITPYFWINNSYGYSTNPQRIPPSK